MGDDDYYTRRRAGSLVANALSMHVLCATQRVVRFWSDGEVLVLLCAGIKNQLKTMKHCEL